MTAGLAPFEDEWDRRRAVRADGLLREFNDAGLLTAADVHVAQRIAAAVGEGDEPVRLAAALSVRALRQGSVCLDLTTVPDIAPELSWPDLDQWAAALASSALVAAQVLRLEPPLLYLDRSWAEEREVCDAVLSRMHGLPLPVDRQRLATALSSYFPAESYHEQRTAAEIACQHWISIITGGPGTGKTTTVARLLGTLLSLDDVPPRIALAAPTGKAAARMAQAVAEAVSREDFPADHRQAITALRPSTLHRLLGWRPDSRSRFRHDSSNRLPHDVVIVDETSMVSLSLMARLLEALRPQCRLVLVGDADQLASVDAGAVLTDLVDGLGGPSGGGVARLVTSHRYGSGIGQFAEAVRAGNADRALAVLDTSGSEVSLVDPGEPGTLGEVAEQVLAATLRLVGAAEAGDAAGAVAAVESHRVLCAHREGPYGVRHWNRLAERRLQESVGTDWLPERYAGQPLLVTQNDYSAGLFNGDTGVVVRVTDPGGGGLVAVMATGERGPEGTASSGRVVPLTRVTEAETAHAMTIHRSQGSQFDTVTVVLPDVDSPLLTRELLYTAVTRARRAVRLVGTPEALRAAVDRRAQRASGLAGRLRQPAGS